MSEINKKGGIPFSAVSVLPKGTSLICDSVPKKRDGNSTIPAKMPGTSGRGYIRRKG